MLPSPNQEMCIGQGSTAQKFAVHRTRIRSLQHARIHLRQLILNEILVEPHICMQDWSSNARDPNRSMANPCLVEGHVPIFQANDCHVGKWVLFLSS
jgi:hypothetical protein